MDYTKTLDYLFSQLPIYQRIGPAAYKADLSNTIRICELLGDPHLEVKTVHIAGTNGKGSVSHMVASVLQEAGYKVGLYTSPHYKDFRERIRINGEMISPEAVVDFVNTYSRKWEDIKPSFFEITVCMAFWHFQQSQVDVAVIETGLGGRLDSTNVITPEVCAITNIGFDHMEFLGKRLEEIAYEKGGIIKEGVPIILGEMNYKARMVLEKLASEKGAPFTSVETKIGNLPKTDLPGSFQKENVRTAQEILHQLSTKGFKVDFDSNLRGFSKVEENTGFKGRWQVLGNSPLIIADSAHNAHGLEKVIKELRDIPDENLHIVLGMVRDKDVSALLQLFPKEASYYFCQADIPRAMPEEELVEFANEHGLKGECYNSVQRAYEAARLYASPEDLIFIGGSVFTVAEII
jgi:dihydrofolate synthase/folylpolyglutamate synthase